MLTRGFAVGAVFEALLAGAGAVAYRRSTNTALDTDKPNPPMKVKKVDTVDPICPFCEKALPEIWRKDADPKIFTTEHDEEKAAEDLCSPEELERLRTFLDKELRHLSGVVARLANRLQRRLLAQQNRAWDFDLEEGVLDAAPEVAGCLLPEQYGHGIHSPDLRAVTAIYAAGSGSR